MIGPGTDGYLTLSYTNAEKQAATRTPHDARCQLRIKCEIPGVLGISKGNKWNMTKKTDKNDKNGIIYSTHGSPRERYHTEEYPNA